MFQHTAARRRLAGVASAATTNRAGFNTQPPEGGWAFFASSARPSFSFQHTAARRRLVASSSSGFVHSRVSTHSRPKAAGFRAIR